MKATRIEWHELPEMFSAGEVSDDKPSPLLELKI